MEPEGKPEAMSVRSLLFFALLMLGVGMWLHLGAIEFIYGVQRWGLIVAGAIGILLLLRSTPADAVERWLVRHRHFGRGLRIGVMGVLFVASTGAVLLLNLMQGSDLRPAICDEYSYFAQSGMLLHGRLWSEAHPHPDFFTTFQFVATPAYASIYFPGTALWLLPWTALDPQGGWAWIGSLLAMGISVVLVYRIVAEMLDDWLGLVTAVIVLSNPMFRSAGMMLLGQAPATMFGLLVVFACLRWRGAASRRSSRPALSWGLLAGLFAAWGMLCRPVDVLAYALPVVVGVVATRGVPVRLKAASIGAAIVGTLPFAAIQLPFNHAVTGSWLQTPFSWYADTYLPGTGYGLGEREAATGPNVTAHYHLSYHAFTKQFIEEVNELDPAGLFYSRLRTFCMTAAPHGAMLTFVPLALPLLLRRPRLWLLAAVFPLAVLLYLPYGFLLGQYAVATIPSLALLMVCGARCTAMMTGEMGGRRLGRAVGIGCLLGLLALTTRGIPGLALVGREDWYRVPELRWIDRELAALPGTALVFFTPPAVNGPIEAEAVYNLGFGFPDSARVVRAHDLGARNIELIRYYAVLQPQREVYHLDRTAETLEPLGGVAELAELPEAELRARFAERAEGWKRAYASQLRVYDNGNAETGD